MTAYWHERHQLRRHRSTLVAGETVLSLLGKQQSSPSSLLASNAPLRELSRRYPDLAAPLDAINARLFDLLAVAREHYYHREMKGSWSIKSVLPTIAPELDYADLGEVADGGSAQSAYLEVLSPETPNFTSNLSGRGIEGLLSARSLAMVRVAEFFQNGRHVSAAM